MKRFHENDLGVVGSSSVAPVAYELHGSLPIAEGVKDG
jgi:hypothetical protein